MVEQLQPKQRAGAGKGRLSVMQMDGAKVDLDWLTSSSQDEYRRKLFMTFEKSQVEYLKRKRQQTAQASSVQPLSQVVTSKSKLENFQTVRRAPVKFTEKRKLFKMAGCRTLTRFFVLDDDNFSYFETQEATKVKKSIILQGATAFLEEKSNLEAVKKNKWLDPESNYRVCLNLTSKKKKKTVFYYSNDLNQLKACLVRIRIASSPILRDSLPAYGQKLNVIFNQTKFESLWLIFHKVYNKRIRNMISFQMVGAQLVDVATQAFQRNRRLLQQVAQLVPKTSKVVDQSLQSTFRTGRCHKTVKARMEQTSSIVTQHKLRQIASMIKTRRSKRPVETQAVLDKLNEMHIKGYRCPEILYEDFNTKGELIKSFTIDKGNSKVSFEAHCPDLMLIEDLTPEKYSEPEFWEKQYMTHVNLNEVSLMATDLIEDKKRPEDMAEQKEYSIKLFGHFLQQRNQPEIRENTNALVEQAGYSVLTKEPIEMYTVDVNYVDLPIEFARLYNKKGFVRIKLTQSRFKIIPQNFENDDSNFDERKQFFVLSRDYRLDFTEEELEAAGDSIKVQTPDIKFFIDRLVNSPTEQYQLSLVFSSSFAVIPTVVKDFIVYQEFQAWDFGIGIEYLRDVPPTSYKVKNEVGDVATINFTVWYSKDVKKLDKREGNRLLVGRYCLLDDRKQMQVLSFNKDDTVTLRGVHDHEPLNAKVSINRLKFIERHGVSVYDLNELPEEMELAKFSWTCTIVTTNKRLLNTIQYEIQETQIGQEYAKRWVTSTTRSNMASGNILCSLLYAKNLGNSPVLQAGPFKQNIVPYVEISVIKDRKKMRKSHKTYTGKAVHLPGKEEPEDTAKIVTWISEKRRLGKVTNLGEFQKIIKELASEEVEQRRDSQAALDVGNTRRSSLIGRRSTKVSQQHEFDLQNIYIEFKVWNSENTSDNPVLLGTSLLKATELIDLKRQAQRHVIELKVPRDETKITYQTVDTEVEDIFDGETQMSHGRHAGTLSLQTLFIPDRETRFNFDLFFDSSEFSTPEAFLHFQTLLKQNELDQFKYEIPRGKFAPEHNMSHNANKNLSEESEQPLILATKATMKKEMDLIQTKYGQHISLSNKTVDITGLLKEQKDAKELQSKKKVLVTNEDFLDFCLWLKNTKRPIRQEFAYQFSKMWQSQNMETQIGERKKHVRDLWHTFFCDLKAKDMFEHEKKQIQVDQNMSILDVDKNQTFVTGVVDQLYKLKTQKNGNPEEEQFKGGFYNKGLFNTSINLFNNDIDRFLFRRVWEMKDTHEYADLYALVHMGIPDDMRIRIWKELLSSQISEFEESKSIRRRMSEFRFNKKKTVYQNYVHIADAHDSLSFRQIDEDIQNFDFPDNYASNIEVKADKEMYLFLQKQRMRSVLRVLILWSSQIERDGDAVSFSYHTGMLKVVQRLVSLTQEDEDVFWVLTGIMKSFPRPFSVGSVMFGEVESAMRYELTAFKALLEQNLPDVHQKLQDYSLPVELLVYQSIASFYSDFFTSDLVLRLWDIIIFLFSSAHKEERKRGTWWLVAPAYLILEEKQKEIVVAKNFQQIIDCYQNGAAISYDPEWFIGKLKTITEKAFVEGGELTSAQKIKNAKAKIKAVGKFAALFKGVPKQEKKEEDPNINKNAFDFEEKRWTHMKQIQSLFRPIMEENKIINELVMSNTINGKKDNEKILDFVSLKRKMLSSLQGISEESARRASRVHSKSRLSRTSAKAGDLPLNRVHVYLHQLISTEPNSEYVLKVAYGHVNDKHLFVPLTQGQLLRSSDGRSCARFDSTTIEAYSFFDYSERNNHLQVQIFDKHGKEKGEKILSLGDLPYSRFVTKNMVLTDSSIANSAKLSRFNFSQIQTTFYLEVDDLDVDFVDQDLLVNFIHKTPEKLNIFGLNDGLKNLENPFQAYVNTEYERIRSHFEEELAYQVINDQFNFVDTGMRGQLTQERFEKAACLLIPGHFSSPAHLANIFNTFAGKDFNRQSTAQASLNRDSVMPFEMAKEPESSQTKTPGEAVVFNRVSKVRAPSTIKKSLGGSIQSIIAMKKSQSQIKKSFPSIGGIQRKDPDDAVLDGEIHSYASVKEFIISFILMSHSTVEQKLGLLFDIVDKIDGCAEGIKPTSAVDLIRTIFERSCYFFPTNELQNTLEYIFTGHVSMVYRAFWTRKLEYIVNNRGTREGSKATEITIEALLEQDGEVDGSLLTVEVTRKIQHTINNYFQVFGTKDIDFNLDVSPFKNLRDLVGQQAASKLLDLARVNTEPFELALFCVQHGERFLFQLKFDAMSGDLMGLLRGGVKSNQVRTVQTGGKLDLIGEYLSRNSNKLFLSGLTRPISKAEFMEKCEEIPLLANLIRVETFYRDSMTQTLNQKTKIGMPVNVLFENEHMQINFQFDERIISQDEGCIFKAVTDKSYQIEMGPLYQENILAEVRLRIGKAVQHFLGRNHDIREYLETVDFDLAQEIYGNRCFFGLAKHSNKKQIGDTHWVIQDNDYLRFQELPESMRIQGQIALKLHSTSQIEVIKVEKQLKDKSHFDSLAYYKHADQSVEWRPCRIVRRDLRPELRINKQDMLNQGDKFDLEYDAQCFTYWVEFLHLYSEGNEQWFHRNSDEVLISANYVRVMQRNFKNDVLGFIKRTYNLTEVTMQKVLTRGESLIK